MGLNVYGSFIYLSRKELHSMEAVVESGCLVRLNRHWLDRISKLPAEVVGEISLYRFFIPFDGVSRNHSGGNTAIRGRLVDRYRFNKVIVFR
jgi:hypothetical protein